MDYKQVIANKINAKLDDAETRSRICHWGCGELLKALESISTRRADMRYVPKKTLDNNPNRTIEGWDFKTQIDGFDVNLWVYLGKDYNNRPELQFSYATTLKENPRSISSPYTKIITDAGLRITWGEVAKQIQEYLDKYPPKAYSETQREQAISAATNLYEAYKTWNGLEDNLGYSLDIHNIRYWGEE